MARRRGSGSRSRDTRREDEPTSEGEDVPSTSRLGLMPDWDERTLFHAPVHHLSERIRRGLASGRTRSHGSGNSTIISLYDNFICRDEGLRRLWESCGLTPLLQATRAMFSYDGGNLVVRALVEFFWDTTNTFHFPWGEMTVTPADFSLITGLEFQSTPLPFDAGVTVYSPKVFGVIGADRYSGPG